jgi:phage shock protein C
MYKSRKDRVIDGVCSGLAEYLQVDVTLVRVLWTVSIFIGGLGIIAYIAAMIIVPVNPDHLRLKSEEKVKRNTGFIWGILLIVVGLYFLIDWLDLDYFWDGGFGFHRISWWDGHWGGIWPWLIIIAGVVYIVYALSKDKEKKTVVNGKEKQTYGAKKLQRSTDNKMLFGVCGGLGHYFNLDPTIIRVVLIIITLLTHPFFWLVAYGASVLIIPEMPDKGHTVK